MNDNQDKQIVLEVKGLKQHFSTGSGKYKIYNKAVDGVTFNVHRGEIFSLVGESGCGKTTTGRTIMRLYEPTDGEVYLLGKRIVAGNLALKQELKAIRRGRFAKIKQLAKKEIKKEEFKTFFSDTKKRISEIKADMKQRNHDQYNKYLPDKEEVKADKELAQKNISRLKEEIKTLKAELNILNSDTSSKENEETAKKINEIKNEIKRLNYEVNENIVFSKGASKSLLKKIQMIFQDPIDSLDPRMTVKEIVSEGLYINNIKNKDIVREKVYEVLKLVGLSPEHASHYPHEFSGGQRQRVGVARAIVVDPEVIIADEPISALDVSIQAQIINLLSDLKQELNLTIVFIAHDLSVVKHFSDTVAVMYYGHIVEMGDKHKIFNNPFHPYTQSLISSIPLPNPDYERMREEIPRYNPASHNYTKDSVIELREIEPGHSVLCSEEEFKEYKRIIDGRKKES